MKLIKFSETTMPRSIKYSNKKLPKLSFSKTGIICLNGPLIELMGLSKNDKVSIAQNEDCPDDWYLFKDADEGYELRLRDAKGNNNMCFCHKNLQTEFVQALGLDTESTYAFLIDKEPCVINGDKTKYYSIIISY